MILRSSTIASELENNTIGSDDPLIITPLPDTNVLIEDSSSSVDLRLGTWFCSARARKHPVLDVADEKNLTPTEQSLTKSYYVPFGSKFILHPKSFVLAVTLEWIRIPMRLVGMISGKSSWGRRGLIIETAPGVHPGFSGCLTLELTNVGEVPIALNPGISICQLFMHKLDGAATISEHNSYVGQRRPRLGKIVPDDFAKKLINKNNID